MNPSDLERALVAAAGEIHNAESALNSLDAAIGDGDHGITMREGVEAIQRCIENLPDSVTLSEICHQCGDAFTEGTGGAIGVIFGEMLHGAARRLKGKDRITPEAFHEMLLGMEESIQGCSKAQPGDKTILDAVHAAASVEVSSDLGEMLARTATAASNAAKLTASMICRVGRARRLGERAIGPGVVAFGVILGAFAKSLSQHAGSA